MAVCARGSVLVFYAVFAPFFNFLGEKKYGSGRFSASGMDDHQLIFLYGLITVCSILYGKPWSYFPVE